MFCECKDWEFENKCMDFGVNDYLEFMGIYFILKILKVCYIIWEIGLFFLGGFIVLIGLYFM